MLSSTIFAQPQKKIKDPNDEPFLPIYPVYPYSPKLIKRGTEGQFTSQLTSELYAPKVDAKDSYSSGYSNQRNPYTPNTYPKIGSPSPSYFNNDPYAYDTSPYTAYSSYPTPYTINPAYSAPVYPNYYYQPYYYPRYFNPAPFPPPPPPPLQPSVDYETSQDSSVESEDDKEKKSKKTKEDETNQTASIGQFVDGRNYISSSSRDLDGQSSTYKIPNSYNQLVQDVQLKNLPGLPLPKTTYRVISVGGQPVGPDYPLPTSYVKAQQVEQLTSQTLATLLAQNAQQQATQLYESNKDTSNDSNDDSYASQNVYNSNTPLSYVPVSSVRTKPDVTYVINTDGTGKIHGEQATIQDSSSQSISNKNAKYSNDHFIRKPVSQAYVTSNNYNNKSRGRLSNHRPVDQTDGYDSYDASQNYGDTYAQTDNKQEKNYGSYQSQPVVSYQTKSVTSVAPQASRSYSYQYYESDQTQQKQNKTANIGNFGAKNNKG